MEKSSMWILRNTDLKGNLLHLLGISSGLAKIPFILLIKEHI
jgi:hypothetical protein